MSDYWSGFITGAGLAFFVLLVFYWLWSMIQGYIRQIQAADRPQAVVQVTQKTPGQVVDSASRARLKLWLLVGILYLAAIALVEYLRPGTVGDLFALFGF